MLVYMNSLIMSRVCAGMRGTNLSARFRLCSQGQPVHRRSASAKSSQGSDLKYFLQQPNVVVVDVRTPQEHYEARIKEAQLIPVQEIPDRLDDFPSDVETPIVVFCKVGQRSGLAKNFLEQVGYSNVFNGVTLETVAHAMEAEIVSGDPART